MGIKLPDSQCCAEGDVYLFHLCIREVTDVIGKQGFSDACQVVAKDCAVMLKAFVRANLYLRWEAPILWSKLARRSP